jgi:hypothetical protein
MVIRGIIRSMNVKARGSSETDDSLSTKNLNQKIRGTGRTLMEIQRIRIEGKAWYHTVQTKKVNKGEGGMKR